MTKANKYIKRCLALLMTVIKLLTVVTPTAFASTSGSTKAATIRVSTKANWLKSGSESITLKQKQQTYHVTKTKTCSGKFCGIDCRMRTGCFGYYSITIYNETDKKTTYKTWDGGQTYKINLGRNKTYKITVRYNESETKKNMSYDWQTSNYGLYKLGMKNLSRITSPYWSVSATNKVSSYS